MQTHIPVIIGVGQFTNHGDQPVSPYDLMERAANAALKEAGDTERVAAAIDTLAACRLFVDSSPFFTAPFGNTNNLPRSIAGRIGADPKHAIYGELGGHSPQRLLTELCEKINRGESTVALLVGGEALHTTKRCVKQGVQLDWKEEVPGSLDDRGTDFSEATPYELAHGIGMPIQTYSLFEQALKAGFGETTSEYRHRMATLFAPLSEVAAGNPYAQYPIARSVAELEEVSDKNYPLTDIYTKYIVAQDNVDQGGAVLLASESFADEIGVPLAQRIYLKGYSTLSDTPILQRPRLDQSRAMQLAGERAFGSSGITVDAIDLFEIYSCFPSAVLCAQQAFGIADVEPGKLTLTGGLPFFGGAGNSYSLFGIAEMVSQLRGREDAYGMVLANGGYMSKESVAIYGTSKPEHWQPVDSWDLQAKIDRDNETPAISEAFDGTGKIESYVVNFMRGAPSVAFIVGRTPDQQRFMAVNEDGTLEKITGLMDADLVGSNVSVRSDNGKNYFELA